MAVRDTTIRDTTLSLPPLSTPDISKELQKARVAQWMRIMLASLRAYTTFRAGGMGKIEQPTEALFSQTWDCGV